MGWFGKDRLKLEDVASDLGRMVLKSIAPEKLEELREWGINPDDSKQKLGIIIHSLFSLRAAIPHALDQDKGITLMLHIEQLLKTAYVDVLKLGTTNQFETLLQKRYEEYDSLDKPGATTPRIGLAFSRNIGIDDIALVHWSEMSFRRIRLMYVELLRDLNNKYQLVV